VLSAPSWRWSRMYSASWYVVAICDLSVACSVAADVMDDSVCLLADVR